MWISDSKAAAIQSSDLKSSVTYSFNTNELFTLSYPITFRPRASWNIQTNKLHSTSTHSINSWVGFWLHSVRETSLKAVAVTYFPCLNGISIIYFLYKGIILNVLPFIRYSCLEPSTSTEIGYLLRNAKLYHYIIR